MIPREGLVCCDRAISQLSNKSMDADLTATGLVLIPVIIVLVLSEQTIIGADVAFQPRIIRAGGMHHNSFRDYRFACFIAGVIC
jgi:hypothetical protein